MLGKRIFTMHDPLAVAVALEFHAGRNAPRDADVETAGRLTTGATIVDWRGQWGRLANTEVAVAVDAERFRDLFFDRLTGWSADEGLEVVGVEVGEFSPDLEAVLVFWVSHEVHGHVFDDGHVLRAVAGA